jgi:hypothetical protein
MRKINGFLAILCGTMLLCIAGCAAYGPAPGSTGGGTASVPLVQNCGVIDAGTPSRFACNGKVYTSYQLAKLREDEAKKYRSGN